MKKVLISVLTLALLTAVSLAQNADQPNGGSQSQNTAQIAPGTILRVELARTVDAKKAKVGDEVIAKTMDDFRSNKNEVLAPRGSKIVGHVAEVSPHEHDSVSTLGIVFDKMILKNGTEIPLKASIQAIGWPQSNSAAANQPAGYPGSPAPSTGNAPGMTSRGAPGTANSAPATAEGTDATGGYGQLTPKDQGVVGMSGVSLSAGAAQDSLLSSPKHNVKLDSGTQMILRVIS